jgi:NTE family protein
MPEPAPSLGPPVEDVDTGSPHAQVEDGIALCLSGGGYRAMLYHAGALWRLNEVGYLPKLARISSVSGGSITAGSLGLAWAQLGFDAAGVAAAFVAKVVDPLRGLAARTIDVGSVLRGALLPGTIGDRIAAAYCQHLYGDATLQDLPDAPRFVINAMNVQTGSLFRFMKPAIRDWRVGQVLAPRVPLARAVGASSAFPPILSPVRLRFRPGVWAATPGATLCREPFTTDVHLSDGGVYDNLGLETAYKRYRTLLVSDGGLMMSPEDEPKSDWARHSLRVLNLIDNQVRSLRRRQLMGALLSGVRSGAFWTIATPITGYGLPSALPVRPETTRAMAGEPTRLARLADETQERLINWGYASCDAALRRYVDDKLPAPPGFPYPHRSM